MASKPVIDHTAVDALQVAFSEAVIQKRADITPLLEPLRDMCRDAVCGPAMALIHYGAVKDGLLVEVAYPVSRPVEIGQVRTRLLPACQAWTAEHHGSHDTMRETTRAIVQHVEARAGTIGGGVREIYHVVDPDHPENNVTEVQAMDHEWDRRLVCGLRRILPARRCIRGISREDIAPRRDRFGKRHVLEGYRKDRIRGDRCRIGHLYCSVGERRDKR